MTCQSGAALCKLALVPCGGVYRDLRAQGLDVFMAGVSIAAGERWSERIHEARTNNDWVIFLASGAACASHWVQQELRQASMGTKTLVTVIWEIAPTELPGWTSQHQALDLCNATSEQLQARILQIAAHIKSDKTRGMLIAGGLIAGLFYLASSSE